MLRRTVLATLVTSALLVGSGVAAASSPPDEATSSCGSAEATVDGTTVDDTGSVGDVVGSWCVTELGGVPIVDVAPSVEFGADGRVSGMGGVNTFTGEYQVVDDTIEFAPIASTLMAGPEPAMQVESQLFGVLTGSQPFAIDGDTLTIGSDDNTATLVRAGAADAGPDTPAGVPGLVTVNGTVTYRERMALPAGSSLVVRVSDVSLADAPATVLAEVAILPLHEVPLAYAIAVEASAFEDGHTYALSAVISARGQMLFASTEHLPVTSEPAVQTIDIVLARVGG